MAISFFIAGDVVPKGMEPEELKNKGEQIFSEIKPYITGADFSIVNLEAPIIKTKPTPIKKSGPCLGADPSTIEVLKNAGFGIFTLANNHFYDQGQNGVDNTISLCNELDIKAVGGGNSVREARKILLLEKDGKRIAIINACEHEFSVADSSHGGSNPLDLINMQEDIAAARKEADYVVLILHGGIEQYHYPTPRMKRWYRHFVDLGADAVINHHQHCINGYEVYKGKPIFYGLGNFYFPWVAKRINESWNNGYAVVLKLEEKVCFELIPYNQTMEGVSLRNIEDFNKEIELYNLPIQDDYLLLQKFDEYVIDKENIIKLDILPTLFKKRVLSALIRRGKMGRLFEEQQVLDVKGSLTCATHLEKLIELFTTMSKNG